MTAPGNPLDTDVTKSLPSPIQERRRKSARNVNSETSSSDTAVEKGDGRPDFDIPSWSKRSASTQWKPFRGMLADLRRRKPYYWSDWTTGFRPDNVYRVAAAAIRMYFINLMPAIAYTLDLTHRTNGEYGINETLLAAALPTILYPIIGVQPLTIVGFTGLINLFNYTNYTIVTVDHGVNYLQFQCWVYIWSAIMHWISGILNICDYTRFITDMTAHCFGLYVGVIYIQKGIELIIYEFEDTTTAAGWLATFIAVAFSFSVLYISKASNSGVWLPLKIRQFGADYGFALACVFWSGFTHIPGNIQSVQLTYIPITKAFFPTLDRSWFIPFWRLEVKWIFVAMPFGLLLTMLFWFDHNVSSLAASARKFPVTKPSGFHWDFFLLGWTTLVAGFLGLPAPNGLIPQAPEHAEALSVKKQVKQGEEANQPAQVKTVRVVEQRVSHFAIGLLTVGTMTRPLLVALGLMPRAVFAGVFIIVGWDSVQPNAIVKNTLYLFRDTELTPRDHPLISLRRRKILAFVSIQWFVFAVAVAISQLIAAIGFPVPYILLIPTRQFLLPKWFSKEELAILDGPVANSDAVIDSIGGDLHLVTGQESDRPSSSSSQKSKVKHSDEHSSSQKPATRRRKSVRPPENEATEKV